MINKLHSGSPESHQQGWEKAGSIGIMLGFVTMMFLDIALG
ncbi:MAG TPA: hypothetical protein V6C64_16920 [Microcoleaceae cyanobacterium]